VLWLTAFKILVATCFLCLTFFKTDIYMITVECWSAISRSFVHKSKA